MSFVIIEGVDGAGKTHLARALAESVGMVYEAVGPPEDPQKCLVEYLERMEKYGGESDVVFDRFHWGSQAYGDVFRGRPDLISREISYLERRLAESYSCVIHCDPEWPVIEKNIATREMAGALDPFFERDLAKLFRVRTIFQHIYEESELPVMRYDYERTPFVDVQAFVAESVGVYP